MARVAINGLGRIGRATLRVVMDTPELELVAVNDLGEVENFAWLIRYDTIYGRYDREVCADDGDLVIDGRRVRYLSERDPAQLPWGELDIDLVFECTGFFTEIEDAGKHVTAGADKVIISGPTKSAGVPMVVHGVNSANGAQVVSCASCTTNNITPVMEVMNRRIGVKKAIMTTVHAYTSTQALVDMPGGVKDMRRGRGGADNIVPSSTGAAIATTKALPAIEGVFDGLALRVPVAVGSIADVVFLAARDTSVDEVNDIFREEAATARYEGILGVSEDPIVSADIIGDARASIVDLELTQVVDGDLVKVLTWYDNEWGYTNQMVREALTLVG